jgi:hypothetical protein
MSVLSDSAEGMRRAQFPDPALLELAVSDPPAACYREAAATLDLRPQPEPDEGTVLGKTACHWCGRSDPPAGLTRVSNLNIRFSHETDPQTLAVTHHAHVGPELQDPAGAHCADEKGCMAARLDREPEWADHQIPDWRKRYTDYLDAERKRLEASKRTAWSWYHPDEIRRQQDQLRAEEAQLGLAVAAEFRPPDSFFSGLAVALAAQRKPAAELELAEAAQGIFAEPDTAGPAPFQLLPCGGPPGCLHDTLRCPRTRGHLHGEIRRLEPRAADPAASRARRSA